MELTYWCKWVKEGEIVHWSKQRYFWMEESVVRKWKQSEGEGLDGWIAGSALETAAREGLARR